MNRRALLITGTSIAVVAVLIALTLTRRREKPAAKPRAAVAAATPVLPPIEEWTARFSELESAGRWKELAAMLDRIEKQSPALYAGNNLAFLHGRAESEADEPADAKRHLQPFLADGNPFRDLALYRVAVLDDSSALRQQLIFGYPSSIHRDEAIEAETEHLTHGNDVNALASFTSRLYPSANTARRRDLDAHLAEMMIRLGKTEAGMQKALEVLRAGTMDDPADRAARSLDHPDLISRLNAQQLATLGETMHNHRHFDRAEALLTLPAVPKTDAIVFQIGRSYFGDEKFGEAQQWYLRGANATRDPRQKSMFLWHAARAAQLMGDDAAGERLMTAAIALPVRTPSTLAALTQRIRLRMKQKRVAEATADLALMRKIAPKDPARTDAEHAYALYTKKPKRSADASSVPRTIELKPESFPAFPLGTTNRADQLMAMGLFDEVTDEIPKRWPLHPANSALTQSLAFSRAGAPRESIYAIEVMVKGLPPNTALPKIARALLYPRDFYGYIGEDAKAFGVDPNLVLAIMREESRFNPRAKSPVAARGLLQLIITTARDIGREVGLVDLSPEDLYDPRIVIRIGTKYLSTLSAEFGGDKHAIVAAYNAGPAQVRLWQRMAPAKGDDYFDESITFDETREYVRKVMKSYSEYEELARRPRS